jgi:hypothetical protein
MTRTAPSNRVLVIFDPEYGNRLRDVWPGQPVWIALSPVNEPVIRALCAIHPEPDHLVGITVFSFHPEIAPEDRFLSQLGAIDLHHGPYSSRTPYTELEVIGCRLNASIRDELAQLGFAHFEEGTTGFAAKRSIEEAAILRS